jgi:hypothetical protein
MGNTRIPKKILNGKFSGRRPVERQRLRWEDIRRDSVADECQRMEEASRGQEHLEAKECL